MPTTAGSQTHVNSASDSSEGQRCLSAGPHGTRVAYDTYRCRCPEARAASSRARKARAARQLRGGRGLLPAIGTVRRLRALASDGWALETLAPMLGWRWQRLAQLRAGRNPQVNVTTHTAIADLYARLSGWPGPSNRARLFAARQGWLGPLWWDDDTLDDPDYEPPTQELPRRRKDDVDEVQVARALAGQPVDLTRAERLEAVRQLREHQRLSFPAIADRLGMHQRQVHRDLTDLGLTHQEEGAA